MHLQGGKGGGFALPPLVFLLLAFQLAPAPPAHGISMSATHPDSLHLTLLAPEAVAPGEEICFTLRLTNPGPDAREVYLRGREITFDLRVEGLDGGVVWQRLEGEIIPAIVRLEVLGPGEYRELRHCWDQRMRAGERVAPGEYRVRGELLTDGEPFRTPAHPVLIGPGG